ncbi:SUKH-3 domain-containing protein [Tenacibaculum jejuense]|uniref:SUKH-3 immunity protein n=1 Tax=Tenacibaculum jejuense TaxID=584609 RepID=A0A238UEZ3_9FLAO|nr:SUKH-3 domain-containing protein [Tenacibaculum jejuense]SNR17731.1 conserved protein of unknown function [Tenacibaculum jejuense]
MKFKTEVEELFKKSGWFEGRNVRDIFDKIPRFHEYPDFLKDFLYEYGDLNVETYKYDKNDITAYLDLTILSGKRYNLNEFLDSPRKDFGNNLYTFPLGYYHLDVSLLQCDKEGKVYMVGDFPTLVSDDFKTGIEKILMEDYSDTKEWHPDIKQWKKEEY